MIKSVECGLDFAISHYAALCIVLALFVLTLVGVGNLVTVCVLGLLLCLAGMTKDSANADPWILIPLLIYDAMCLISAWAADREIADGYGIFHAIFPTIYLLACTLDHEEKRVLMQGCVYGVVLEAIYGISRVVFVAVTQGGSSRMSGILGNPNAMGIFLILGWFLLLACTREDKTGILASLEPILLVAAAMTLSMGSFVAMAAGIVVLVCMNKDMRGRRSRLIYACRILAKVTLGMGTGILMYLVGARTTALWLYVPLLGFIVLLAVQWRTFEQFLDAKPVMAAVITAAGVLVAIAAVLIRPSAIATFQERVEMMGSGLHYLTVNPLVGVGPFQWRVLDASDGGTYFNTWHIHNSFLHVGVEMGWLAMVMLIVMIVEALRRQSSSAGKALITAFIVHNLIDTSFFYLGITGLVLAVDESDRENKVLSARVMRLVFVLLGALFVYGLCRNYFS